MLFRIYDVIFAEGASETIMRVALSLMRKNEEKLLACTELEDVMHLLLSRGLWDCYHYNADELVNDFVSLTGIVTHESLQALEKSYKASQPGEAEVAETVGSAAARFLGRLWAGSNASTKSANLSPVSGLAAPSRPVSFLRRSPSKQSIASTLNSIEGGGSDSIMSSTTEATTISRDSSHTDGSSIRGQSVIFPSNSSTSRPNKDKNLHGQIEDLLTALSEMQRDHAILATQLQKEREEREEDRQAVRSLLDGLRKKTSSNTVEPSGSEASTETVKPVDHDVDDEVADSEGETVIPGPVLVEELEAESPTPPVTADDLSHLLDVVEERFAPNNKRRSSMLQSKSQLRDELARCKEQLINEVSKSQDFSRQLSEQQQEINNLKDQVKEGHGHFRTAHAEKQRLEKQVNELRTRKSIGAAPEGLREPESEWPSARQSVHGGLRELKLGRTNSGRAQAPTFTKRSSSLNTAAMAAAAAKESESLTVTPPPEPKQDVDMDALVLELVQAKTAEATAKQEAEEAKSKLESLRKMLGMGAGDSPGLGHRPSPSQPMIERSVTYSGFLSTGKTTPRGESPAATTPAAAAIGNFWGGWGKRTASTEKATPAGN